MHGWTTKSAVCSSTLASAASTVTVSLQPGGALDAGTVVTVSGFQGTAGATVTLSGAAAGLFVASPSYGSGSIELVVAGGQTVPSGSVSVVTFDVTNSGTVPSVNALSVLVTGGSYSISSYPVDGNCDGKCVWRCGVCVFCVLFVVCCVLCFVFCVLCVGFVFCLLVWSLGLVL